MPRHLEHSHDPDAIRERLEGPPRHSFLSDWIYGGIDGAVTTFAIVASVVGANLSSKIVLVLGLANLIADGFAMAASNYIATKAESDNYARLLDVEKKHIDLEPEGEREEIRQIFAAKGFAGDDLERIVSVITSDESVWARTMAVEEYGLSTESKPALLAAANTYVAFIVCGLMPLVAFIANTSFATCIVATACTFFIIGAAKSRWSSTPWWRSGLETLLIGMSAAGLAYGIGLGLRTLTNT